jgi:uncharacterized membrane protein
MSNLLAIAYDDVATAETVRNVLVQATKEQIITLDDAVVVSREGDGKVKLHQGVSTAGVGAAGGALWGGLIGLLFLAPLVGMAIGAASGAAAGALTDAGVDDKFMKDLGSKLEPGNAALILLVRSSTPDKVLPRVQEYGGHVIQTSLSAADEDRLRTALGEKPPVQA